MGARGLVLSTTLAALAVTPAAAFNLGFHGTALPGSEGDVFVYAGDYETTSFVGQPVDLLLSIGNSPGGLYVQSFTLSWSGLNYSLPYVTSFVGDGFPPNPDDDYGFGFISSVGLTSTGGSISISPTPDWIAETDGEFDFTLNFALSSPHPVGSPFTDSSVTGSGRIDAGVDFDVDPVIGPYDADSTVLFTLNSVSDAPEPGTWVLMLVGVGLLGAAVRSRRHARNAA